MPRSPAPDPGSAFAGTGCGRNGGRGAEPIASKVGKGRVGNQRWACILNCLSPRVLLNEIKQKEEAERPLAVPHL